MSKIIIADTQEALEQLMIHRASRTAVFNNDPHHDNRALHAHGKSFEKTTRSMMINLGEYYDAVKQAAETDLSPRAVYWHCSQVKSSLFGDGPLPGFVLVNVTLKSGVVVRDIQVKDVQWSLLDGENSVETYHISAHPDNFWVEKNNGLEWTNDPCEPTWMKVPKDKQRVRVRYGSAYKLGVPHNSNDYVYWDDFGQGWMNRFGQTILNVVAWQELSPEAAQEQVEDYFR